MNPQRPLIRDLDSIPHEDWLDVEHHFELAAGTVRRKKEPFSEIPLLSGFRKNADLFTVRGCLYECSYCINSRLKQLYPREALLRKRSIPSLIARVEQLVAADPALNLVHFYDDDIFVRSEEELEEFARRWKERIGLPFYVQTSPTMIQENKLKALLEAGLYVVDMGIQTGSERTNFELYGRRFSNESVLRAAALLNAHLGKGRFGLLPPWYDLIINNPYETADDLLETVALLRRLPKPYVLNILNLELFQGTKLYEKAVKDGIITGKDEVTKYNFHDTVRHFRHLVERGGHFYLNSLLYWMEGHHRGNGYGIVPGRLLGALTGRRAVRFFERRPGLVSFLNTLLPAQKRVYNVKQRCKAYLDRRMAGIFGRT